MSVEELLEKYKGAYTSDFEVASASGSKGSSDSEASGDEEVETDEEESDAESNTSSSGTHMAAKESPLCVASSSDPPITDSVLSCDLCFFHDCFCTFKSTSSSQSLQVTAAKKMTVRRTSRKVKKRRRRMIAEMMGWSFC